MTGEPQTWYRHDPTVVCGCGSKSGHPITAEWWNKHTDPWHTLKHWLKRKLRKERP